MVKARFNYPATLSVVSKIGSLEHAVFNTQYIVEGKKDQREFSLLRKML